MRGLSHFLWFLGFVLIATIVSAEDKTVKVVGFGECADCKQFNIKTSQAFSGLKATVDCKLPNGEFITKGSGELNVEGKFEVSISKKIIINKDGKLSEDCHVQLHSAYSAPCPLHSGLEASKIVPIKPQNDGKTHTFGITKTLKFSAPLCASQFLWPPHPWFKKPPIVLPPIPSFPPLPPFEKPCPRDPPKPPKPKPGPKPKPDPKPKPKPMPMPKPCLPELTPKPKPFPSLPKLPFPKVPIPPHLNLP